MRQDDQERVDRYHAWQKTPMADASMHGLQNTCQEFVNWVQARYSAPESTLPWQSLSHGQQMGVAMREFTQRLACAQPWGNDALYPVYYVLLQSKGQVHIVHCGDLTVKGTRKVITWALKVTVKVWIRTVLHELETDVAALIRKVRGNG